MNLGLFLDMDGTVTESRSIILPEMAELLGGFSPVIIVSGAEERQMRSQLLGLRSYLLAQNGNHALDENRVTIWRHELPPEEKKSIVEHARSLFNSRVIPEDCLEDRGCQISLSLVGHHAPRELKVAYDPGGAKRRELLSNHPAPCGIEAKVGGTTTIDYFKKGRHKGFYVRKFINQFKLTDAVYIGDAIFPGGNDETVVCVCRTIATKNPQDTIAILQRL